MTGEPEGQMAAEPAVQYWPPSPDLFSVLLSPRCAQAGWHPVDMITGQHLWDQRVGQREGGSSCTCSGSAGLGPQEHGRLSLRVRVVMVFRVVAGPPDHP